MKINPNNYPYPFLSNENDNYVTSEFNASTEKVKLNEDTNHFEIDVKVLLKNKKIENLIKQNDVSLSIHATCPKTYYNKIFDVSDALTTISIDKSKVAVKIELNALLTVNLPINNYTNNDFHKDFKGIEFNLIPGNLLGGTTAGEVIIENMIPEKIESIFILKKNSKLAPGEMNATYNANKIAIYLSEKDHNNYQRLQSDKELGSVLYSLIVVPALVDVIYYINENYSSDEEIDGIEDLDWFKSISEKLEELDISFDEDNPINDPMVVANNLIDNPLEDALSILLESGEENE